MASAPPPAAAAPQQKSPGASPTPVAAQPAPSGQPAQPLPASAANPSVPAGPNQVAAQPPVGQQVPGPAALANKPGEPAFQLKTSVDKLVFKSDKLAEEAVTVELNIQNTSGKRQCFKMKCTSNDLFTVRPPLGFIEKDATAAIKIVFQSKDIPVPNLHYFAIYHMEADEKADKPRALWTAAAVPQGVKRLACSFEKENGTVYMPEKK